MRQQIQPQQPAPGVACFRTATRDIITVRSACRQPFGARVAAYKIGADGTLARLIFAHDRRPKGATP